MHADKSLEQLPARFYKALAALNLENPPPPLSDSRTTYAYKRDQTRLE